AKKEAVIEHFALKAGTPPEDITERVTRVGEWFVNAIDDAYFNEASAIDHIDIGLLGYFRQLKDAGIKIAFVRCSEFSKTWDPPVRCQAQGALAFDARVNT
ncbi:phnX, partial [Symbiodinium sp. CCMP2456]